MKRHPLLICAFSCDVTSTPCQMVKGIKAPKDLQFRQLNTNSGRVHLVAAIKEVLVIRKASKCVCKKSTTDWSNCKLIKASSFATCVCVCPQRTARWWAVGKLPQCRPIMANDFIAQTCHPPHSLLSRSIHELADGSCQG